MNINRRRTRLFTKNYPGSLLSGIERHNEILSLALRLKNSFLYTSSIFLDSSFLKILVILEISIK